MESIFSESDWDSFSESSEEMDIVYGGNGLILLSNLEESITKIDNFLSFERGFVLGDVVYSVADPFGQMGRVVGLDMSVDLESTKGRVIEDVSSKNLIKIRAISSGDYVVFGHWVGRVEKVVDSVIVVFDDGAKSDFCPADPERLVPITPNLVDESQYPYYPGQRVQIRLPSASRSAKWLCGSWKLGQEEGTVQLVKAGLLHVEWLSSALIGFDVKSTQPPKVLRADDVTLLSCLEHVNWQLGDWCMLGDDYKGMNSKQNPSISFNRMNHTASEICIIARTKTRVDVVWQDGSCSFRMESQSLLPVNIVDAHEFWPEQFVLEKRSCENPGNPFSRKWGFVRAMDAKEKTVKVIWKNASAENTDMSIPGQSEQTMSAYELMDHPDYSVCFGNVVFKMMQIQTGARNGKPATFEGDKPREITPNQDMVGVYLSCVGNVIGFKDGSVEVKWANGCEDKVSPSEIIQVNRQIVLTESPSPISGNVEQIAIRMVDHQTDSFDQKRHVGQSFLGSDADEVCGKDSPFSVSQYASSLLLGVASSLFGAFGSQYMGAPKQSALNFDGGDESSDSHDNLLVEVCDPFVDTQPNKDPLIKVQSHLLDEDIQNPSSSIVVKCFERFDMVTDCSDHQFFNSAKSLDMLQVKRGWLRKIRQEWNILEKNLPETIYVRAYEERMDLLRAAIIGPEGTPYHYGLFFFDVFLPPDYPKEPPMVHYRSGGLRINPNLYESGRICLSLLNTWSGSGSEVWKPESSTILQVLVSLQALVLNDKPYFNEAGYDKQVGRFQGEKNSTSYNENTFLLNCQSMLYILQNPPKHFEALIDEHFSYRCRDILLTCKEYIEGAPVGFPSGGGDRGSENKCSERSSTGFKIMLTKLQARLVDAFAKKGIDRCQFLEP